MKFFSVLAISALALVCTVERTAAATCTQKDGEKMMSFLLKVTADENCSKKTSNDCPNAECLKTTQAVYSELPDCTYEGKNVKTEFAEALKKCGVNSAAPSFSASTAAVALSSTAIAVAAVYL